MNEKLRDILLERAQEVQNSMNEVKSFNIVVLNGEICVNNIEYQ